MRDPFKNLRAGWMGMTLFVAGCQRGGGEGSAPVPPVSSDGPIRPPAVANQFYPGQPEALRRAVRKALREAEGAAVPGGTPVAILVPHAGYVYSAGVAAFSYQAVAGRRITDAILIGNSHHVRLRRGAVYARGGFATPLGTVPVNAELAAALLKETDRLADQPAPHEPEHSLEVQLPFLQELFPGIRIVPILLSAFPMEDCRAIGEAIARAVHASGRAETTLIVNSTDMSHYPSGVDADRVDRQALKALEAFDADRLAGEIAASMQSGIPNLHCVFCGEESLYATMAAARALGADRARVLHYAHSGDISGDRSRVVGYGAAAFVRTGEGAEPRGAAARASDGMGGSQGEAAPFSVSVSHQAVLLRVARESIASHLATGRREAVRTRDPELLKPAAVFVTLTRAGQLRGCIGVLEARAPLVETVADFAVAAAVEDGRFPPVTAAELPGLRIEISVLSPMTRVASAEAIEPGRHGVLVRRGRRQGLFLPQVWEHFRRKEDFLDELCRQKAHLDARAWQDPETELRVFTVFAFEEPE